jgi:hypothetical protein
MNGYSRRSLQLYTMEEQGLQHVVYDLEDPLLLYHSSESTLSPGNLSTCSANMSQSAILGKYGRVPRDWTNAYSTQVFERR